MTADDTRDEFGEGVRDLLAAILEAIAIPYPKTVGDAEIAKPILLRRTEHVRTTLHRVLAEHDSRLPLDLAWETAYLRERLAEHPPVGYRTTDLPDLERGGGEDPTT